MRRFLIIVLVLGVLLPIGNIPMAQAQDTTLPQQILQLILSLLPHPETASVQPVQFQRMIRENIPGDLTIGTRVVFQATPEMMIGQTGTTIGTIAGYSFLSYAGIAPASLHGPINPADWEVEKYIIRYDRAAGNAMPVNEFTLYRSQFLIQ